jgi:hypothetical protein
MSWRARMTVCLLAAAAGSLAVPVMAGPPFVTDDPEPVPYQHFEFYIAGQYSHERDGDGAAAPSFELNYGAAPNLQLHLVAPFVFDGPDQQPSHYGYGDTELGAKFRFIQETDYLPQVGVFPLVELPTGAHSRGLGNGKTQVFVPIWLQKSWGNWTSYGGGGWFYNPGEGNRNFWRVGWELQRRLREDLVIGGEIFYESPDARDARDRLAFNLGGIYDASDHIHLLFSAGRDFIGPTLFTTYAAVQFAW